jgi:hypothetical protein
MPERVSLGTSSSPNTSSLVVRAVLGREREVQHKGRLHTMVERLILEQERRPSHQTSPITSQRPP